MRLALFAMLPLILLAPTDAVAQRPRTAKPAAPTKATITVTDLSGTPLHDVRVILTGGLDRSGSTQPNGVVAFDSLKPGTYRLRFEKDGYVLFERELEIRAGQPPDVSVALTEAPATGAPDPAPTPEPSAAPPPGKLMSLDLLNFIERNFISGSQPQKVSPIGCSGLAETVLWQVREPWDNRQHDAADALVYVVGGEGTMRIDGKDVSVAAGSFVQIPRGTTYAITRRGRNPVILLATLVGAGCP